MAHNIYEVLLQLLCIFGSLCASRLYSFGPLEGRDICDATGDGCDFVVFHYRISKGQNPVCTLLVCAIQKSGKLAEVWITSMIPRDVPRKAHVKGLGRRQWYGEHSMPLFEELINLPSILLRGALNPWTDRRCPFSLHTQGHRDLFSLLE